MKSSSKLTRLGKKTPLYNLPEVTERRYVNNSVSKGHNRLYARAGIQYEQSSNLNEDEEEGRKVGGKSAAEEEQGIKVIVIGHNNDDHNENHEDDYVINIYKTFQQVVLTW